MNCYSSGIVEGQDCVGGLVGYMNSSSSKIDKSYSRAEVSGPHGIGGLVGVLNEGRITNSYFCPKLSGTENGAGASIPLTLDQMKNKDYYTGWDFTSGTVWKMEEFPQLIFKFTIPQEEVQEGAQ